MLKSFRSLLIILLLLPNFAPALSTDDPETFVITGVTVISSDSERVLKNQNVVIADGRIRELGPAGKVKPPDGATVIDGTGKYLIPGLFDMHIHLREDYDLTLYLANGVTTVQNMSGSSWHLERRAMVARGDLSGPRIFTTGPTTARVGINSPEEAEQFVIEQKEAGYDAIKQYGNGSNSMTRETYQRLIATAKKHKMRVVGHAPRNMPFSAVLEEGQDSIDHAEEIYYTSTPILEFYKPHVDFQFGRTSLEDYRKAAPAFPELNKMTPVVKKLAREVKASGMAFTPTLTAFETIWRHTNSEYDVMMKDPELIYIEPVTRASWGPAVNRYRAGWSNRLPEMDKMLKQSLELQKMMVAEFIAAGVPVMTGTDAPLTFVYPGFTLHHELELFVESGATPFEALKAATLTPAKFLGIEDDVGTVTAGKRADLVLLDADPLKDIRNTRRISGVFANGRWLAKKDLTAALEKIAESYRPHWQAIEKLQPFLEKGEVENALRTYREAGIKNEDLAGYLEGAVNAYGYQLIRANDLDRALEVLKLNTEYFPNAFNTWDSLAEIHLLRGDQDLAVRYYKKSLELNPDNTNAADQLKKLEAEN